MRRIASLTAVALLVALLAAFGARADEIEVRDARLRATEEGLVLDADFAFDLTPRLLDVVGNGVPLYFRVDFELTRHRWYWFDESIALRRMQLRLSYHALSRQYRLSTGLLQQNFATLEEALNDPHNRARQMVVEVDHPTLGKVAQLGVGTKLSETPGAFRSFSPSPGQHTDEVLASLGYDGGAIAGLRERGVVG